MRLYFPHDQAADLRGSSTAMERIGNEIEGRYGNYDNQRDGRVKVGRGDGNRVGNGAIQFRLRAARSIAFNSAFVRNCLATARCKIMNVTVISRKTPALKGRRKGRHTILGEVCRRKGNQRNRKERQKVGPQHHRFGVFRVVNQMMVVQPEYADE
jgi:hypothetical protein